MVLSDELQMNSPPSTVCTVADFCQVSTQDALKKFVNEGVGKRISTAIGTDLGQTRVKRGMANRGSRPLAVASI